MWTVTTPTEWAVLVLLAVAVGLDLYLALLVLVLLTHLSGISAPVGQLGTLSGPWIGGLATILYLVGWAMRRGRRRMLAWETFHVPVKMAAAGLLVLLLLPDRSGLGLWIPVLASACVAGGVQTLRLGWDTILAHDTSRDRKGAFRAVGEDALVIALISLGLAVNPLLGGMAALIVLLAVGAFGGPALRAARFTPHLFRGMIRHALGISELRPIDRLPGWIRRTVEARTGTSATGIRGTRAALLGLPDGGIFRSGWFVQCPEGPVFMYRTLGNVWEVNLFQGRPAGVRRQPDLLRVDWRDEDGRFAVLLPRSAPEGDFRISGGASPARSQGGPWTR